LRRARATFGSSGTGRGSADQRLAPSGCGSLEGSPPTRWPSWRRRPIRNVHCNAATAAGARSALRAPR
jgi:hypothetical protein